MKIFKSSIKIRTSILIIILLIIGLIITSYYYHTLNESSEKLEAVLSSLIAGFFVAIVQFLIQYQDFIASEKVNRLKIVDVLIHRDNREYYRKYLLNAKNKIDMMGVSGYRFMEHFADLSPDASSEAKVILDRVNNGIKVRILMPEMNELLEGNERKKAEAAKPLYEAVKQRYPDYFEVKFFSHIPTHSIFLVDDESIVGPIFPGVPSKHTPAIHAHNSSPFVKKYIEYFEKEWELASDI